ncbi:unnamed protein product [Cylindrotheca closterium]|uniref:Uncharacterized protein n=1 Tax=Cylindrotheca closterium TaxID=2856 RepID=A0AAD2JPC0_9STRA|nr:unnamed protein product [Cylindrotheca closterium]
MTFADPQLLTSLDSALSIFLASTGSAVASAESGIYALRKKGLTAFMENASEEMTEVNRYRHLSAGLSVGLACLTSGFGIARFLKHLDKKAGIASDEPERPETEPLIQRVRRAMVKENFVHLTLSLVFLEAIGLCGSIVALFLLLEEAAIQAEFSLVDPSFRLSYYILPYVSLAMMAKSIASEDTVDVGNALE